MKKRNFKILLTTSIIILHSQIFAQSFDLMGSFNLFGYARDIEFDYSYEEFNISASSDSSTIMESFNGVINLYIENSGINFIPPDTTKYNFTISKKGNKILRTNFDTLSVEYIEVETEDSLFEISSYNNKAGSSYIYGWIFPDTLNDSVDDTLEFTPTYPYSKMYRYYDTNIDNELFVVDDTLQIHYRPHSTNYNDSYFSIDYFVNTNTFENLIGYEKYYSYFGAGFSEKLKLNNVIMISSLDDDFADIPNKFYLNQNYPNPFNPTTMINYSIPIECNVNLKVFDALGKEVAILVNENKPPGDYNVIFNANRLSSGVYFYRIQAGKFIQSKKLVVLK